MRRLLPISMLLLLALESGCTERPDPRVKYLNIIQPLNGSPSVVRAATDITTGEKLRTAPPAPAGPQAARELVADADHPVLPPVSDTSADQRQRALDYVKKADVYWKLNWIRKQLIYGPLPFDIAHDIAKTRKELRSTLRDSNYDIADAAVTHLERGLQHLRAQELLTTAHVDSDSIPWDAGEDEVQRTIDQGRLGFGKKPGEEIGFAITGDESDDFSPHTPPLKDGPPLTQLQQQVIAVLQLYARRYHCSPLEMMRREWRTAIERTNRLRDELGLMHRPQNDDGDLAEINPEIGRDFLEQGGAPDLPP